MSFYSPQIVLSKPQVQIKQGQNVGRVIGKPSYNLMSNPTLSKGITSPMMRSDLIVYQPPQQRQHQNKHDLNQYLVQPQKLQKSISQKNTFPIQNNFNLQSQILQKQTSKIMNHRQVNNQNNDKIKNILLDQRNPSINYQLPLQQNRTLYDKKEQQNQSLQKQTIANEKILNRTLSPQPQQRYSSPQNQLVQRAVSPYSTKSIFDRTNPQFNQSLYQPTRYAQSPQHQHRQSFYLNNRNSLSCLPRNFYKNQQESQSKSNSISFSNQQQTLPYKLELPLQVKINQQRMNDAIERSKKIKKHIAEKQLKMKCLQQNIQQPLEISKLLEFQKYLNDNSNELKSQESFKFLDVSKLQVTTPLKSISNIESIQSPFKTEYSQISIIQNKIQIEDNVEILPDQTNGNTNTCNPPENYSVGKREMTFSNNIEQNNQQLSNQIIQQKGIDQQIELTLNYIDQNQLEFKNKQQEFKQSTNNFTQINQFNTQYHNSYNSVKQEEEQNKNKENCQDTSISAPDEIKSEFKSTINQFKRSFQNNMYSTPKSNKKKFQKKIQMNEAEYQGGVENEIPNGYGILKDKNGQEIYKGDWKNGLYDGSGILINRNSDLVEDQDIDHTNLSLILESNSWIKYEGDLSQNKISGFGTIYFKQNQKFVGNLFQGIPNGQGSFYNKHGDIITAIWENGKLVEIL